MIYITECPRDAMQGLDWFVNTQTKISYIKQLYYAGFDRLDFTAFVSAKAISQMQDADDVAAAMQELSGGPDLLAIVANIRGTNRALSYPHIAFLGFPLSVSQTFQLRNTNKTIEEALEEIKIILELSGKSNVRLQIYLSMAFGNPYNEFFDINQIFILLEKLNFMGIKYVAISDTIGAANPELVNHIFSQILPNFPNMIISAHLHSRRADAPALVRAALAGGCRHFDSALGGFGGCPMASDTLTGNLPTEILVDVLKQNGYQTGVKSIVLEELLIKYNHIFVEPNSL